MATITSDIVGKKPEQLLPPDVLANLRKSTPGYDSIIKLLSGNILSGLQGQLAPGVANVVSDAANARAVGGGFGGSGLGRNLELRDLGLTSKGVMDQALAQAFNFIPMQSSTATVNQGIQNEINQFNNLVKASPDPVKREQFLYNQAQEEQAAAQAANSFSPGIRYNNGVGIGGGLGGSRPVGPGQFQPAPVWNPAPIGNGNFSGTATPEQTAAVVNYGAIPGAASSPASIPGAQQSSGPRPQINGWGSFITDTFNGNYTGQDAFNFGNQPAYDVNNILLNTAGINPADFGMA